MEDPGCCNTEEQDEMKNAVEEALKNNDMSSAVSEIQEYLGQSNNTTLNIAITGESGSGKSTFVNAMRGLGDEDEGSAPTGVVETTVEPTPYPHRKFPNVTLWDLPGIGTPDFQPDDYLRKVQFDRYDFFIIISSGRFRSDDVKLATRIQDLGKKFYFVRSKIDTDMANESRKKGFNKDKTLDQIRGNCITGLKNLGVESPNVFLVSSVELHLYDFHCLTETMEQELPGHKRHALLLSIPNISLEIHNRKKKAFKANMWLIALTSGAIAALPVPGLSFAVDITLLVAEICRYLEAFGLDDVSLRTISNRSGVSLDVLKSVLKSPLSLQIDRDVIIQLLTKSVGGFAMVAEEALSFAIIPVIGSILAASLSFTTTYYMLNSSLDELAADAQNVLTTALKIPAVKIPA